MQEFILKDKVTRMRYHDFPGNGTPIVFVHGLGCAGSFDYPQVASQSELCDNRRILVDLIGSGFSDKPDSFGYSVSNHAEYLADFISYLNLEEFILFGHSLGGAIALDLANRCTDRLQRIILSESNLDSGGGFTSRSIATYKEEDFLRHGFQDIIDDNRNTGNALWAASFSVCSPLAMHRISKSAVEGETPSWREILYALKCPRTFVFGENSLPDPDVEALKNHGVHIEVVKKAGHSMAWENPQGLAAAIRNGMLQ